MSLNKLPELGKNQTSQKPDGRDFENRKPKTDNVRKLGRILIVDKDPLERKAMRDYVGEIYDVESATSGEEALKRYKEGGIDLVVADIQMPDMNGNKLLSELLSLDKNAKVIIVSDRLKEKQKKALLELGAFEILDKPLGILDLNVHIGKALES